MGKSKNKLLIVVASLVIGVLMSHPAHALRCKSKLVKDGMHEQQVLAICGNPTSMRHLGYVVRSIDLGLRRLPRRGFVTNRYPSYSQFSQEVAVTEYVYNFGPRKLMRRLVFEGSILVSIDTIGYGYIEQVSK